MSQQQQQQPPQASLSLKNADIKQMIHRLKTRLALANFKRQYGFERYDLHTLESNLLRNQIKKNMYNGKRKHDQHEKHRYYPTNTNNGHHHGTRVMSSSSSSPSQQALAPRYPVSEKRSTSPQQAHKTIVPTDEDAANVLVMLHNMASGKPASSPLCI
ncbi:ABC transporter domain-containing protein [Mucor velutinosus]|uniref:ABC transporter domain-containing protein n=1 Tax=Mucor velutinosus TaxID=708070 RepID=A0AAN7DQA1_9FUNG|nr:ABC transporter domain-containing protein [Mucor velutinosus]